MSFMTKTAPAPAALSEPTPDQMAYLKAWRVTALEIMPYMAPILFAFRPLNALQVDTYACDEQYRLYINFDRVIALGPQFNAEALLHEAFHIAAQHGLLAREMNVQPHERRLWNTAADAAINDDLRDAGCSELANWGVLPEHLGMPDNKAATEYFNELRPLLPPTPPEDGGELYKGCGSVSGGQTAPCETAAGVDSIAAPVSEAAKEVILVTVAARVRMHQSAHGVGSVPAELVQELEDALAEEKIRWERVVRDFVRRSVSMRAGDDEASYSRQDRRRMNAVLRDENGQVAGTLIAPGRVSPVPVIHYYRDTSFSVSDEKLQMANAEVTGIARALDLRGDDLLISDIDTKVHSTIKYRKPEDLIKVHARGGTDMAEAIRHANAQCNKASCIIIATDGETGWPAEPSRIPVIALLLDATEEWKDRIPSWITVVEVEL